MSSTYEIFLGGGEISAAKWREFLLCVSRYLKFADKWRITAALDGVTLHYYLESPRELPLDFGLADFLLKPTKPLLETSSLRPGHLRFYHRGDSCLDLLRRLASCQRQFRGLTVELRAYLNKFSADTYLVYEYCGQQYLERLSAANPTELLAVNFSNNKNFSYKKFPKYLKNEKILKLLQPNPDQALLKVDAFPYVETPRYLSLQSYDFEKHSVVLGSSGSGKSKFLASLINQIYQTAADKYKVVVIDPHDSLKADCQQISSRQIVDFCSVENSINLFQNSTEDLNVSAELTLMLFRSLMGAEYNTQLERVLRFSSYLLISTGNFSFMHLRRLLTDLEYCSQTVAKYASQLPDAVTRFFLADFSELKAKSYAVAIAPVIAFIDEMQMVPVFNQEAKLPSLADHIQNNFLTVYSLSRPKLGYKVVQTIAGLLLQQLFLQAQRQAISEHLIVIIDEVAIVENPILSRFLSELRKYRTSLILAGQYFGQFSPDLREAIFANVSNYYVFRVSKRDAELLVKNLDIKLASSDKVEDQQGILTSLKDRECLAQISKAGETYPACKAQTLDFCPPAPTPNSQQESAPPSICQEPLAIPGSSSPAVSESQSKPQRTASSAPSRQFDFSLAGAKSPEAIMTATSTSRKKIKEDHA